MVRKVTGVRVHVVPDEVLHQHAAVAGFSVPRRRRGVVQAERGEEVVVHRHREVMLQPVQALKGCEQGTGGILDSVIGRGNSLEG